jgi:hypothetical protein
MTYAPPTLRAARALLTDNLDMHPGTSSYPADLDPAEVGIVGDTAHAAGGTSYHLGEDDLVSTAYSIRTARDKAGLSDAASAVDVGEFRITTPKGTFTHRDLAMWSVEQCQLNHPDTRDIREIIYSPDGVKVLRYDRERGYASEPREGESSTSHRTHNHYSQYRDAEFRYTLRDHYARWLTEIGVLGMSELDTAMATATTHRVAATLGHMESADYSVVVGGRTQKRSEPNKLGAVIDGIAAGVQLLVDRPVVETDPADVAMVKAAVRDVLLEPQVLAAIAEATASVIGGREAAADRARADVLDGEAAAP